MTQPKHILVVDDEAAIRSILRHALEAEGYIVSEAGNKAALFLALESESIDLVTLDLGLEMEDGLLLAHEIRAERNVPIIMITGRGGPIDRVTGLELGADDYISKPFHIREVILRIRGVLRRYEFAASGAMIGAPTRGQRFAFESGVLDAAKREFRRGDGVLVDLTDTEFQLLEFFLRHPVRVLSRDEILQEMRRREWSPLDRTIDGHVARLRRKIEPPGEAPTFIKSVRGVGYVFTGNVTAA